MPLQVQSSAPHTLKHDVEPLLSFPAAGMALLTILAILVVVYRAWRSMGGLTSYQLNRPPKYGPETTLGAYSPHLLLHLCSVFRTQESSFYTSELIRPGLLARGKGVTYLWGGNLLVLSHMSFVVEDLACSSYGCTHPTENDCPVQQIQEDLFPQFACLGLPHLWKGGRNGVTKLPCDSIVRSL